MYEIIDKGEININLKDGRLLTVYSTIKEDVATYRIFINSEYETSGKYTKGSGILTRKIFYRGLILTISTDADNAILLGEELFDV